MSTVYDYTGKTTNPDAVQIQTDVAASAMTDKTIEWVRWDADVSEVCISFTNALDGTDKTTLDTIVSNNS